MLVQPGCLQLPYLTSQTPYQPSSVLCSQLSAAMPTSSRHMTWVLWISAGLDQDMASINVVQDQKHTAHLLCFHRPPHLQKPPTSRRALVIVKLYPDLRRRFVPEHSLLSLVSMTTSTKASVLSISTAFPRTTLLSLSPARTITRNASAFSTLLIVYPLQPAALPCLS